ncbi:MAG: hypothetical protein HC802_03285 [Caldilineaceae bacterium]|nr:hypothetical protein [Caldilineaceae bacterium]
MARENPDQESDSSYDAHFSYELAEFDDHVRQTAPSLSIILISAACGIGGGAIGLYVAYQLPGLGIELSAGLAALMLCFSVGIVGALLSAITDSRAALANIAFSCGLIGLVAIFFALCSLIGAFFATLILSARL